MNTQSMIRSALVAIAAVSAAFATIAPAIAADDVPQVHVRLGGFNPSNMADRKLLERKIRAAALQVCPGRDSSELSERVEARRCFSAAMKSGEQQLAAVTPPNGKALAQLELTVRGAQAK